ncbi:hypothetical protein [Dyella sp.]|uniref:hypothetical protein n=1 Tax=Dyella sp. TaxID=1869338 RepID=UPI002ED0AF58
MKNRHVYSTPDISSANAAMAAARQHGVPDDDISLIARSDIELEAVPDDRRVVDGDFYPAALRGVTWGGAAGLLAGLLAVVVTPIGLTLAGVAATTVAGAAVGTWTSALAGSAVPDPVRRKFEDEIEQGHILVVLDGEKDVLDLADSAIRESGATALPFETPSIIS